jgi:hypothetical protein
LNSGQSIFLSSNGLNLIISPGIVTFFQSFSSVLSSNLISFLSSTFIQKSFLVTSIHFSLHLSKNGSILAGSRVDKFTPVNLSIVKLFVHSFQSDVFQKVFR